MKKRVAFVLCILMLGLSSLAFADEGMWLFNAFPKDKVKAKYGFAPDDLAIRGDEQVDLRA